MGVFKSSAADMTYETFTNEVDKLIGQERSWTNLVLAYYVGRRVVSQVGNVKRYFSRYVSQEYQPAYEKAGGVVSKQFSFVFHNN